MSSAFLIFELFCPATDTPDFSIDCFSHGVLCVVVEQMWGNDIFLPYHPVTIRHMYVNLSAKMDSMFAVQAQESGKLVHFFVESAWITKSIPKLKSTLR